VSGGEYVSCRTRSFIPEEKLKLKPPADSMDMWLSVDGAGNLAAVGFTPDGDILVPSAATARCDEFLVKANKHVE
jgi:hypothetical protein